ncbi:hypothetical protein SteCoe_14584 [Stentor coeruleus]|uniref:Uncharacterized protein n=1 Tax=Stentor coeruleus TaxID=5963 RepID=A0A1R2C5P9_9CILI|nr:hypothetical protein SteCoe_14584 [Stentor coeruleus]
MAESKFQSESLAKEKAIIVRKLSRKERLDLKQSMIPEVSRKISRREKMPDESSELQEIKKSIESIKYYVANKVVRSFGPAEYTKLILIDENILYSGLHGYISKLSILTGELLENIYFGIPIIDFVYYKNFLAISTFTEFKVFLIPSYEQVYTEELQISCISSELYVAIATGEIFIFTEQGKLPFIDLQTHIISLNSTQNSLIALTESLVIINKNTREIQVNTSNYKYNCVSVNEDFIVAGYSEGVDILNIYDLSLKHKYKCKHPCLSVYIGPHSDFILSGFKDNTIKLFELSGNQNEITLRGHTNHITHCAYSDTKSHLVSISKDNMLKIWSFPTFPEETIVRTTSKVVKVFLTDTFVIYTQANKITSIYIDGITQDIITTKGVGFSLEATPELIFIGDDMGYVYLIDLKSFNLIIEIQAHKGAVKDMAMCNEGLITGGLDSDIHIWSLGNLENFSKDKLEKKSLKGHKQGVIQIFIAGDYLFSASIDQTVRVWSLVDYQEIGVFNTNVTSITVGNGLITGDHEGFVKMWNTYDLCIESTIKAHNRTITSITLQHNLVLSASLDGIICVISYQNRQVMGKLHFKEPILCMSSTEKTIAAGFNDMMTVRNNPLFDDRISILGPPDLMQNFFTYVNDLCLKKFPEHNFSMDQFIILPYYYNCLHFYTYLNLPEYLSSSLDSYSPIVCNKFSPLSFAMQTEMISLQMIICKYILQTGIENRYAFRLLEDSITTLNSKGFPILYEIYEAAYSNVTRNYLPKACSNEIQLPIIKLSRRPRIQIEDFIQTSDLETSQAVFFKECYLGINMNFGSLKSIEFLESLIECPTSAVLKANFIQDFVKHKWEVAKYPMIIQAFMYFFYMIALNVYIEWFNKNVYFLGVLFFINIFLLLYEIFQMMVFKSYFTSIWNYLDWLRGILLFLYAIFEYSMAINEEYSKYSDSILALLTITSWVRGISYFRIFDRLRYFIRLLQDSIKNVLGFLYLLSYLIIAFSIFNLILDQNRSSKIAYVLKTYELALGSLEPEENIDIIQYICLTLASILLCIMVLNIMISLIGDSFAKVKADCIAADTQELLEMIMEVENMLFTKRSLNSIMYLQSASNNAPDERDSVEDRIGFLEKCMNQVQLKQFKEYKESSEIFDRKTRRIGLIGNRIDRLFKIFKL